MIRQNRRLYSFSDGTMLSIAEAMLIKFKKYKAPFFAYDSRTYNEAYIVGYEDAISAAHNVDVDVIERAHQAAETGNVQLVIKDCKVAFDHLEYYVLRAFPESETMRNQFGVDRFAREMKRPDRFVLFMESIAHKVVEHRADLAAVNCPDAVMDTIISLAARLHEEKLSQKDAIRSRPQLTAKRSALMNAVWKIVCDICDTAKKVFAHEPDIAILFKRPARSGHGPSEETGTGPTPPKPVSPV